MTKFTLPECGGKIQAHFAPVYYDLRLLCRLLAIFCGAGDSFFRCCILSCGGCHVSKLLAVNAAISR